MPSKMWDEITHPFQNVNGCTIEVWEFHPTHHNGCNCLSILEFKLNEVSKRGPSCYATEMLQYVFTRMQEGHTVCLHPYLATALYINGLAGDNGISITNAFKIEQFCIYSPKLTLLICSSYPIDRLILYKTCFHCYIPQSAVIFSPGLKMWCSV